MDSKDVEVSIEDIVEKWVRLIITNIDVQKGLKIKTEVLKKDYRKATND